MKLIKLNPGKNSEFTIRLSRVPLDIRFIQISGNFGHQVNSDIHLQQWKSR